jgi:hypothetical protein
MDSSDKTREVTTAGGGASTADAEEDCKTTASEEPDGEDGNIDVVEALRDMGNSTGDAGLLHLAKEVEEEDTRKKNQESDGKDVSAVADLAEEIEAHVKEGNPSVREPVKEREAPAKESVAPGGSNKQSIEGSAEVAVRALPLLPPHLSGMEKLDTVSVECQKFLLHVQVFTASVFLAKENTNHFAVKYEEWRTALDPNVFLAAGSARDYLNKWRKRVRNSLEAAGVCVDDLGDKIDYVVATPELVYKADKEEKRKVKTVAEMAVAMRVKLLSETKTAKAPRRSLPVSVKLNPPVKRSEIKFVSLILNEPGTFGLKVENTAVNGVRISEVLPGLQGERAGFQKGDVVASATMDTTNFEPDLSTLWGQNMMFDDFVHIAQSQRRPIVVRVRRGDGDGLVALQPTMTVAKRGRPRKPEHELKRKRPGSKQRVTINENTLHHFEIKKLRVMREEIIRAHGLRVAADAFDKSLVKALKHCPIAMTKAKETAQLMREEFTELWNNPGYGEWEAHLKALLEFKHVNGHVNVPRNHPDKGLLNFLIDMRSTQKFLLKGAYKKPKLRDRATMEVDILKKLG